MENSIELRVMSTDDMMTTIRTDRGARVAERLAKFELHVDEVFISCIYEVSTSVYDFVFSKHVRREPVSIGLIKRRGPVLKSKWMRA